MNAIEGQRPCTVAIVGAGIMGAATALALAELYEAMG